MGVPWEPLCVVLNQVLPFTGFVPLSKPVWDPRGPGLSLWGAGVEISLLASGLGKENRGG